MRHLIGILIVLPMLCIGQDNLVPNGEFEVYSECPWTGSQIHLATPWQTPNSGSPEYFHQCSTGNLLAPPVIVYGYQQPHSGSGFIGIYTFSLNQPEGREYIQVQLTEPIHAGVRYQVGFHVSLAELSLYAVSSIGAHLSVEAIQGTGFDVFEVEPDIQNPPGNIIADTSGWVLVTDTFVSRIGGGEQFITIGNFNSAADSDTFRHQPINPDMGNFFFSYYYIDDVSVVAIDSVPDGIADKEQLNFSVYPNPATDVVRFRISDSSASVGMTVKLLDAVGRELVNSPSRRKIGTGAGKEGSGEVNISHLPPGIYFLNLQVLMAERP